MSQGTNPGSFLHVLRENQVVSAETALVLRYDPVDEYSRSSVIPMQGLIYTNQTHKKDVRIMTVEQSFSAHKHFAYPKSRVLWMDVTTVHSSMSWGI